MGSRRGAWGLGWAVLLGWVLLGCDGSDRVSLAAMPEGAAGGGAAGVGATDADGLAGDGLQGRMPEGSPMIAGVDGLGDAPVASGGSTPATGTPSTPSTPSTGGVDGGTRAGADPDVVPGAGGASTEGADAGSQASPAAGGGASSSGGRASSSGGGASSSGGGTEATGADDAVIVNLEASALSTFAPPIDSSRYAVAGYDAAAGVCVSIVWDYSNNGLELARHCDDFGQYVSFPYVLVEAASAAGCVSFWGYVGLQPSAASGCIDPVAGLVNVRLEVESEGVRYSIRAVNEPALVGP
jgi:hypothetical protein